MMEEKKKDIQMSESMFEYLIETVVKQQMHINVLEARLHILQMKAIDEVVTDRFLKKFGWEKTIEWVHEEFEPVIILYGIDDEMLENVLRERLADIDD